MIKIERTDIKIGDRVLEHNTRKTTRKGMKLSKNWNGPYVVENVPGKGTYRLSGLKHAINANQLKIVRDQIWIFNPNYKGL